MTTASGQTGLAKKTFSAEDIEFQSAYLQATAQKFCSSLPDAKNLVCETMTAAREELGVTDLRHIEPFLFKIMRKVFRRKIGLTDEDS